MGIERGEHRLRVARVDDEGTTAVVQQPDVVVGEGGQGDRIHDARAADYRNGVVAGQPYRTLSGWLGATVGRRRGRRCLRLPRASAGPGPARRAAGEPHAASLALGD